ncbi:MAG TPA: sigma-54-dependent Fis family transcriptional regulator, partial [Candidatus Binatia bacterium]|nr:sigma-54-dependent Fis family transcriptional regulator [Candidatus Binatia bacterium]
MPTERERSPADPNRIRAERDLYLRLLSVGQQDDLAPFLEEALALIAEVAQARQGYLELFDEEEDAGTPRWWMAHGFSAEEVAKVREAISRGIIAEALATGRTIVTASAQLDPRFSARDSVIRGRIEAVLCAPIGSGPPRGVLYLQGSADGGVFSDEVRARAEMFAHHLAPFADRLLLRHRTRVGADPTAEIRQKLRLESVIGRSPALASVLKQVALAAPIDVTVLLTGESGTGKSQLARLIHDNGPRAARPFVELNCAALPEALVESELFGAFAGAHSTAARRMEGKVAAAEHGTLFLDEVGELPPNVQAKLLQFLQSKEFYPLGSSKSVKANVRLIAASNADLRQAVTERSFREDLFYRLNVLSIRVPSLAERRADIAELARGFAIAASEQYGLARVEISQGALRAMETAEWPGNVRQLQNAVSAAVIRAAGEAAKQVELAHLFPSAAEVPSAPTQVTFQEATRQFQARLLRETLQDTGWSVVEAARRLDLARSHVYN